MIKKSLRAYITCRQLVLFVLPHGKVFRFRLFQILKQFIDRILELLIVLTGFAGIDKFQQRREVLFFLRGFIVDIADECAVEQAFCL